jgi:catechol 2,3-dioxygenase-like lactoylglutathione lyase family enzyme
MENNWRFHHVATVVKDMDEAVVFYESLGIFTLPPEFMLDSTTYADYSVYGKKPVTIDKTRMRFAEIGSYRIELVSPIEGEPIYKEFLRNKGEGIHHIAFMVDDLDAEVEKMALKDIPMITRVKRPNGRGFAYFDITRFGNVIIELIQAPR